MTLFTDDVAVVLAGEAGQGIQTIETFLVRLLKSSGYHVFATKEYMSRVRGGLNTTTLRVASHRVAAFREKIDILVSLHKDAVAHLRLRITEKTVIIGEGEGMTDSPLIDVPFTKIAAEMGNSLYANTLAVGLIAGLFHLEETACLQFIEGYFKKKEREVQEKNIAAAQKGFAIAAAHGADISITIDTDRSVFGEMMITGGEAVALGALAGGCNYLAAYPMSPSTAVLTQMAACSNEVDVVVEQVEDEIGVVNMALGASYAGARAMVTTSGGGFALMTEGMSLAGMIETPLVVHLAQRPGPATGLPTRTEQGDLHLVLHAGHGAFPRIILAPRNLDDAFYLSQRAFNLAAAYQVPVFILTDQYLIDTYYNVPVWETDGLTMERHIVETGEDYRRFAITETGVSPRGIPGFGRGIVCVDSDEHDEGGYITEDFVLREKMVEKRLRKYAAIRQAVLPPVFTGSEGYETLIVGWGSTYPALTEAMEQIGCDDCAHLHFSWLYPLPDNVNEYVEKAKQIIVVEGNATGQFSQLLKLTTEAKTVHSVLKYNGLPFSVEELVREIGDKVKG